jgi:hypothetical protein
MVIEKQSGNNISDWRKEAKGESGGNISLEVKNFSGADGTAPL